MIDDFKKNILTEEIFNEVKKESPYYEGRWKYFSEVIEQLEKLEDIHSVLEFGPFKLPFVKGEDIIDYTDKFVDMYPFEIGKFMVHDCSQFPIPVEDNSYDLVIACQVLEHFGIDGEQVEFFNELERITRIAIVSLPYKWFRPNHRDHHMIDKNIIRTWSGNRKPVFEMITGNNERALRILQIYDFENGSSISEAEDFKFKGYVNQEKKKDKTIEKLKKQNEKLKNKNKKLKKKNDKLKKDNERINDELNLMKSTKSWKMTKPLRNINSKFK